MVQTFILAVGTTLGYNRKLHLSVIFNGFSFLQRADVNDEKWMDEGPKHFLFEVAELAFDEKEPKLNSCNCCMFRYLGKKEVGKVRKLGSDPVSLQN